MAAMFEVEVKVAEAAAFSLSPARICDASLPNSRQPFDHWSSMGICQKIVFDGTQHLIRRAGRQLPKPTGEYQRFNEYHTVGYTTEWYTSSR